MFLEVERLSQRRCIFKDVGFIVSSYPPKSCTDLTFHRQRLEEPTSVPAVGIRLLDTFKLSCVFWPQR